MLRTLLVLFGLLPVVVAVAAEPAAPPPWLADAGRILACSGLCT